MSKKWIRSRNHWSTMVVNYKYVDSIKDLDRIYHKLKAVIDKKVGNKRSNLELQSSVAIEPEVVFVNNNLQITTIYRVKCS